MNNDTPQSTSLTIVPMTTAIAAPIYATLDQLISIWLAAKTQRSGSAKTRKAYADTLTSFRAVLNEQGLDLDSDSRLVALAASTWAGLRGVDSHHTGAVSAATFNQRLACVASFYGYVKKQDLYQGVNPITRVDRRKVIMYDKATALHTDAVTAKLGSLDRTTPEGQRDYALLSVALTTGRRASELAGLRWCNVEITSGVITLSFHAKGGKLMRDTLTDSVARALLTWLYTSYGAALGVLAPDAAIWCSLARNAKPHEPITVWGIGDICQRRLGTRKVHSLRHTFAHAMVDAGATMPTLQARLGHASLQTTGIYVDALNRAENKHVAAIAAMFGIE